MFYFDIGDNRRGRFLKVSICLFIRQESEIMFVRLDCCLKLKFLGMFFLYSLRFLIGRFSFSRFPTASH